MLSERLYTLRKKRGISQEQLAEALGVSRQSVSKWESGASTPESDRLIAISEYFDVSLDALLRGTGDDTPTEAKQTMAEQRPSVAGLVLCLAGVALMLAFGLLMLLFPAASEQIADSSAVTLDGRGLILLLGAAAAAAGAVMLLKNRKG